MRLWCLLMALAACRSDKGGEQVRADPEPTPDVTATDATDVPTDTDTDLPFEPPARILFIGNSFTFGGPVPTIVDWLANDAGWPDPHVEYSAYGGESLSGHRNNRPDTLTKVDAGNWDVVVLQELSTRPTDNIGDPLQFKTDATWFHDRIVQSSPDARVVLYETWARHPDHGIYPGSFTDPTQMQAQLRFHYNDAADTYIPANASEPLADPVVAPCGDAWEAHLAEANPLRLHGGDDYHAGPNGQYLNALVIYATLYARRTAQLGAWQIAPADAARLQATTDALTGYTAAGGPNGLPPKLRPGERIRVDVGSANSLAPGAAWNQLTDSTAGALANVVREGGAPTRVDVSVVDAFVGVNTNGLTGSGWPDEAGTDSFFCGSFTDHAAGLQAPGAVRFHDLAPGDYTLTLFASRSGNDGGLGRLTRYSVGSDFVDLEVADNTGDVSLSGVRPASDGTLELQVAVSPAGTGRFCYLGVVELRRD